MKLSLAVAKKLLKLIDGSTIANSSAKGEFFEELLLEGVLIKIAKGRKVRLFKESTLRVYLSNTCGIADLEKYVELLINDDAKGSDSVKFGSDSKIKAIRTFKGFLINSYNTIEASLNDKPLFIESVEGVFNFIYDFESFVPSRDITIVGVENAENFRMIKEQKYLFSDINPLFISRYPQNQSKDFIKWLKSIPNNYLHFGDFDFAGIGIYLNEYKKHIGDRARFFIPPDIEKYIKTAGCCERFDKQKLNFNIDSITEPNLLNLINSINKCAKGLDQEFFINKLD